MRGVHLFDGVFEHMENKSHFNYAAVNLQSTDMQSLA
mgnify:CR=1 FL=1